MLFWRRSRIRGQTATCTLNGLGDEEGERREEDGEISSTFPLQRIMIVLHYSPLVRGMRG